MLSLCQGIFCCSLQSWQAEATRIAQTHASSTVPHSMSKYSSPPAVPPCCYSAIKLPEFSARTGWTDPALPGTGWMGYCVQCSVLCALCSVCASGSGPAAASSVFAFALLIYEWRQLPLLLPLLLLFLVLVRSSSGFVVFITVHMAAY